MQLHVLALAGHNKDYQPPRVLTSLSHVSVSRAALLSPAHVRSCREWLEVCVIPCTPVPRLVSSRQPVPCGPKTEGVLWS